MLCFQVSVCTTSAHKFFWQLCVVFIPTTPSPLFFFSICFRVSSSARHSLPPRPRWIPRSLISGEWSVNMKLIALWCYAHRAREKRFGSWFFIDIFSLFFFGWFLIGCNFYSTFPLFFVGGPLGFSAEFSLIFSCLCVFCVCLICCIHLSFSGNLCILFASQTGVHRLWFVDDRDWRGRSEKWFL